METTVINGMCRCCASEGAFKDIKRSYQWMGEEEVYGEMLKECFDIDLSATEDSDGSICEVCITQLRNACNFKKQVLQTEDHFKKQLQIKFFKPTVVKVEMQDENNQSDDNISLDDGFSGPEFDMPIKKEGTEDSKPKKRAAAAKASTSRAKKSKANDESADTSTTKHDIKAEAENSMDHQTENIEEANVFGAAYSKTNNVQDTNKKRKKTPKERMREYRARVKGRAQLLNDAAAIYQEDSNVEIGANIGNAYFFIDPSTQTMYKKHPKTAAERMREYRARKKNKIKIDYKPPTVINHQIAEIGDSLIVFEPSGQITVQKRPKTVVERMREYRARKRNMLQSPIYASSVVSNPGPNIKVEANDYVKNRCILALTSNEIMRRTRDKSPLERMYQYRTRKRNKIEIQTEASPIIDNEDCKIKVEANDSIEDESVFAEPWMEIKTEKVQDLDRLES